MPYILTKVHVNLSRELIKPDLTTTDTRCRHCSLALPNVTSSQCTISRVAATCGSHSFKNILMLNSAAFFYSQHLINLFICTKNFAKAVSVRSRLRHLKWETPSRFVGDSNDVTQIELYDWTVRVMWMLRVIELTCK